MRAEISSTASAIPGDVPGPPVQFGPPIEPETVKSAEGFTGIGMPENDIFYFHPDHLGSTSYITTRNGSISQHVEYIAFGEVLFEEHSSSFSSPYLFNGKELDRETNLSYYGARYYDAKTSLWLNVDPLAVYNPVMESQFYVDGQHNGGVFNDMNLNSYGYCYQNPIRYIDPNGKQVDRVKHKIVNAYIPEATWPNVYKTHKMGVEKGNPLLITYDSDRTNARKRRNDARVANNGLRIPEHHLDEYPYASTKEGGKNAAINTVPASENMSHGGYLGSLVRLNDMKTGDKFNIILVPKPPKEPEKVPDSVPEPKVSKPVLVTLIIIGILSTIFSGGSQYSY